MTAAGAAASQGDRRSVENYPQEFKQDIQEEKDVYLFHFATISAFQSSASTESTVG
jgi:hypothetical protein